MRLSHYSELYHSSTNPGRLQPVRNVELCQDECSPRNAHDTLIGTAACAERQMRLRLRRDVNTDDSEVTPGQFENVGTTAQRSGRRSVCVRIRSESPLEHAAYLTIVSCRVNFIFASVSPCRKQFRRAASLRVSHDSSRTSERGVKFR